MKLIRRRKEWLIALLGDRRIDYIGGPEVLPAPFSRQEEEQVFARLKAGDPAAREELIVHNLRLVVYIAKKFETPSNSVEDLISIGSIGLIKAVETFDVDKNIKLATYASRCIENEILMFLRKAQNKRQDMSIDEPLNIDYDGNELLLADVLGTDDDCVGRSVENDAERRALLACVDNLTPREQTIMKMRFGLCGEKEHTQKEVATAIGISQSYISRIEKRVIKKLRRDMEKAIC